MGIARGKNEQRYATKHSYIFGVRAIIEAIIAGRTIDKVFIDKSARSPLHKELRILLQTYAMPHSYVPRARLNKITPKNHQGAIAYLAPITFSCLNQVVQASYETGKTPCIVLLDGITDVRNFGAIVRTASCADVDAVVIPTQGCASLSGDVMKTSAGALAHVSICRVSKLSMAITLLKACGLKVVACTEHAAQSIYQTTLTLPIAFLLGSEGGGISPHNLQLVDQCMAIPTLGPIASLNVSVAAAVALYECRRQRGN